MRIFVYNNNMAVDSRASSPDVIVNSKKSAPAVPKSKFKIPSPASKYEMRTMLKRAVPPNKKGSATDFFGNQDFSTVTGAIDVKNTLDTLKNPNSFNRLYVTVKKTEITGEDLYTLLPKRWLNDNIVNSYGILISAQSLEQSGIRVINSHFYSTFVDSGFKGVEKWAKKITFFNKDSVGVDATSIFALSKLFIPVNIGANHWVTVVVHFDASNKTVPVRIEVIDSLHNDRIEIAKNIVEYVALAFKHEADQNPTSGGGVADLNSNWKTNALVNYTTRRNDYEITNQINGYDCGVYCCWAMRHRALLAGSIPLGALNPKNVNFMRRLIFSEIITKKLATIA